MRDFTLHELQCFDAVVGDGGFQAAAERLHRSHPSVFAAVGKLERRLGLRLLDRSGYRVRPTEAGEAFHRRVRILLHEAEELEAYSAQLAVGEEAQLRVVLGDLCPSSPVLELLSDFFAERPRTLLHLQVESVTGPWERLLAGEADLIVHRVPKSDARMEWIDLGRVAMVPVVAPGFLPDPLPAELTPTRMQAHTQCVIRDSARHPTEQGHFLIDGAPTCSVPDHLMKKQLVMRGMAWGHLPRFLIETELRDGRLVSIAGRHFPGVVEELAAARRRDRPHGPVADELWRFLIRHAPLLQPVLGRVPRRRPAASGGRGPVDRTTQRVRRDA